MSDKRIYDQVEQESNNQTKRMKKDVENQKEDCNDESDNEYSDDDSWIVFGSSESEDDSDKPIPIQNGLAKSAKLQFLIDNPSKLFEKENLIEIFIKMFEIEDDAN